MDLAKPSLDVGLFTNRRDAQIAFWQQAVGLAFDHLAKLGGGVHQHRHHMGTRGAILKVNHARDALPASPACGYRGLVVARPGLDASRDLVDPDGDRVRLAPPGHDGIDDIAIRLAVRDRGAFDRFYGAVLGFRALGRGRWACGDTVLIVDEDAGAAPAGDWRAPGYRYITVQVPDVVAAHGAALARGAVEGMAPTLYGTTARVSFVRDPDGNWIEISERASVTGRPVSGEG